MKGKILFLFPMQVVKARMRNVSKETFGRKTTSCVDNFLLLILCFGIFVKSLKIVVNNRAKLWYMPDFDLFV